MVVKRDVRLVHFEKKASFDYLKQTRVIRTVHAIYKTS